MPQTPAQTYSDCEAVDYTPSVATLAGTVVQQAGFIGITVADIAANDKGSLATRGLFKVPKITGAIVTGLPVFWNATGSPVTGDASSGAANQAGTGVYMGIATESALSGDSYAVVDLNASSASDVNSAVTATADGLTTALIPASATFVTVTSANANHQISLPAGYVGKVLRILVGTTACEMISSVAADKVNEVTVGATNELALTAEALYTCVYTKAGFWIVNGQTKLGAAQAALVPDAL